MNEKNFNALASIVGGLVFGILLAVLVLLRECGA